MDGKLLVQLARKLVCGAGDGRIFLGGLELIENLFCFCRIHGRFDLREQNLSLALGYKISRLIDQRM